MLPTTQVPVLRPTPTLSGMNGRPSSSRLLLALLIEGVDPLQHVERRLAGVELVILVVERRVPERHDGVAHIFVDGALAVEDRVGERRQEAVHQRGQALRVALVGLRDRGEAAHVGEHDGHLALLAAEHQLFRRQRQLRDQRRRQILAEGRTDLPALRLLADEARKDQRQIDRRGRHQGIGEIDQAGGAAHRNTRTFRSARSQTPRRGPPA